MGHEGEMKSVGKRVTRVDGPEMVTGQSLYADDIQLPGMLYGRILHSPHAHARIRKIDTRKARALPGVVDVVTAADVPGLSVFASDEVRYEGEKVAIAVAEDADIAEDALDLIKVDYEVLPAVIDPDAAIDPDAPTAVLGASTEEITDADGRKLSNIGSHRAMEEGDVARAFAEADAVVESEYRIPFFHQNYMEPNSATARVEADGRITVWTSCQGIFNIRSSVAGALKLSHGQVRVVATKVGGAFGAKNGTFTEPHAALMAMRTGRPVKVTMSRTEEFLDGRPAPGLWARLKMAAKKDGTLTAVEGRVIYDGGCSGRGGSAARLRGLYRVSNVKLEAFSVYTNKPGPGAYRAPGSPQAAFVRESTIDQLARKLGMDPYEFRLKNAVAEGDVSLGGRPLPRVWFQETLQKTAASAKWGKKRLKRYQGRGVACGEWTNGSCPSNAFITLREDGTVALLTGQVDITGMHTALAQIVAEGLGIPAEKVTVQQGDTDSVPYTGLSAGSMATYSAGTAAYHAAQEAQKRILKVAAGTLEAEETDLEIADERVRVIGAPDRSITLAELATAAIRTPEGPVSGQWVLGRVPSYPSFSVDIVTVEVDPETGRVRLLDVVAGQDIGRAVNPVLVEGQMEGGATQGLGFGAMEGYRYNAEGRLLNADLLDYPLPTALDIPTIQTVMVEEPAPDGPYGGKGVGEPPIIPGAAALANAIHDATGARVTELPITPERVLAAIRASADGKGGQS